MYAYPSLTCNFTSNSADYFNCETELSLLRMLFHFGVIQWGSGAAGQRGSGTCFFFSFWVLFEQHTCTGLLEIFGSGCESRWWISRNWVVVQLVCSYYLPHVDTMRNKKKNRNWYRIQWIRTTPCTSLCPNIPSRVCSPLTFSWSASPKVRDVQSQCSEVNIDHWQTFTKEGGSSCSTIHGKWQGTDQSLVHTQKHSHRGFHLVIAFYGFAEDAISKRSWDPVRYGGAGLLCQVWTNNAHARGEGKHPTYIISV